MHLTVEDISNMVRSIGPSYSDYADGLVSNGVSGEIIAEYSEEALVTDLIKMGILSSAKKIHNMAIVKCF